MPKAYVTGANEVSALMRLMGRDHPAWVWLADTYNTHRNAGQARRAKPPFPKDTICVELSTEDLERHPNVEQLRKAFNVPSPQN